jgi:hypothetical protein
MSRPQTHALCTREGGLAVWRLLRSALARVWRWSRAVRNERRTTDARARFWSEVREGEREAESRSRP